MLTEGVATTSACAVVVGLAVVAGCGEGASRDGFDAEALPVLTLTEELRIGSVDDPDLGFSRIGGVTVDEDGNVYVLERQDREVRVFDPAGRLLRVIGGEGEGPGEFRDPLLLGFRGDSLWVNDGRLRRITMFNREGEVLSTFQTGLDLTVSHPAPGVTMTEFHTGALRSDGLLDMRWPPLVSWSQALALPDSVAVPVLRFDRAGNVVDTTAWDAYWFDVVRVALGGQEFWTPVPAPGTPLRLREEDVLVHVDRRPAGGEAATFAVTRTRSTNDTVYHRVFHYRPRAFSTAWVDSVVGAFATRMGRALQADSSVAARAFREAAALPAFQPPVSLIRSGADGSLWLRREVDTGEIYRWMILRPDGSPRGQVELPKGTTLQWMSGDVVYAVERDDLDVPWIVRYGMRRTR